VADKWATYTDSGAIYSTGENAHFRRTDHHRAYPKAFDVLLFLVQNPNRLITKEELFKAVWADSFVEEGNLTQNIFLLRKALAQNSEDSGLILTIPRKGYQFAADVAEQLESTDKDAIRTPAFRISAVSATQTPVEGTRRNRDESPQTAFLKVSELAKVEQAPSKPDSRFRLAFVISTIAVILIVAGYISWQRFRIAPPPRSEKSCWPCCPSKSHGRSQAGVPCGRSDGGDDCTIISAAPRTTGRHRANLRDGIQTR